jgi:hypothetical protein
MEEREMECSERGMMTGLIAMVLNPVLDGRCSAGPTPCLDARLPLAAPLCEPIFHAV